MQEVVYKGNEKYLTNIEKLFNMFTVRQNLRPFAGIESESDM